MKVKARLLLSLLATFLIATMAPLAVLAGAQSNDGWIEDEEPVSQQPASSRESNPPSAMRAVDLDAVAANKAMQKSTAADGNMLLKGGVTFCVPKGTEIKLKMATVPMAGMRMLNRDMDGKLPPAQLNQEITAKTTEDIYVDDNKVIPQGTVFHGHVSHIFPPKRVGRPGSLVLTFDTFERPDGKKFAFHIEANNTRKSTAKSKAKGFGIITAHAAGGAVVGALVAYQIFGLQSTIAMHGYNIAGGAAAGALMGTAVALMRHGPEAVLEPGDDLNMEIDTDMLIPAATAPVVKAPSIGVPGLGMKVLSTKVVSDGLDGHQLRVKAEVQNNTKLHLQSIDLFLEDDNGARFPVVADCEEQHSDMLFTIDPYSSRTINVEFGVEYPKLKRKLVWVDHNTRQPIFEAKLP